MNGTLLRTLALFSLIAGACFAVAENPEQGPHKPSQSAADALREATGADVAFLPAGMVRNLNSVQDLAQILQYPTDLVGVIKISGSQVRQALERSVSLLPLGSSSFLQLSGLEATYSKSAPAEKRIISVMVGSSKLDDSKDYRIAMPMALARGGLGYFKVWKSDQIEKTAEQSLESILSGKKVTLTSDRWIATP